MRRVEGEVRVALERAERVVLAVSGGRDSMALLEAAARVAPRCVAAVATFDHGTGAASTHAAQLVEERSRELGFLVVRRTAAAGAIVAAREAAWRAQRWAFLREIARDAAAAIATAHTRDDQLETVVLRILRGAGARGIAALAAPAPGIVRPLLPIPRAEVAAYAAARGLQWVEDPSNLSRAHLRNRLRLDLLPAMLSHRPELADELLALADEAAELRRELDDVVANRLHVRFEQGELAVARTSLVSYDPQELALLWPALAARAGAALDRRGTTRLAQFTKEGRNGQRVQLSGGREVVLHGGTFRLRAAAPPAEEGARVLRDGVAVGGFRFRVVEEGGAADDWIAELPADRRLTARAWHPGDRMRPTGAAAPRRVKRLLREGAVDAAARRGWPVVLADGEIVWVPGVRRARAATVRPGGPVVRVLCERILDR